MTSKFGAGTALARLLLRQMLTDGVVESSPSPSTTGPPRVTGRSVASRGDRPATSAASRKSRIGARARARPRRSRAAARSTSRWTAGVRRSRSTPTSARALQVAHHLERVGGDWPGAERRVRALRAEDAAAHRREGVALRLDLGAALQAARQLGPEAHRVEQVQLEPARDHLARHLGRRRVEPRERLGQQPEGLVRVGRSLAEAIRQLDDVPGRGGRVQVVAQAQVRVLQRRRGDDVEGAADGQHQLHVAERLEAAADPRARCAGRPWR